MHSESLPNIGQTFDDMTTCEHGQRATPNQSMSLPVDSHVKTCPQRERGPALKASEADCTAKSSASLAFFDQESSSWKTYQRCFLTGWESYAETWPRSGMVVNGRLFRLPDLVRHTKETAFSYWPTAMASDQLRLGISREAFLKALNRNKRLGHGAGQASGNLVSAFQIDFDGCPSTEFAEWLMGFPLGWTEIDGEESGTQ